MRRIISVYTVFILVMTLISGCATTQPAEKIITSTVESEEAMSNLNKSLAINLSHLELGDGQPLLQVPQIKIAPARPDDPLSLPQLDQLHWYDMEYAAFGGEKINLQESPRDGAIGKKIVTIVNFIYCIIVELSIIT